MASRTTPKTEAKEATWIASIQIEKRHWSMAQCEVAGEVLKKSPHWPLTADELGGATGQLPEFGVEMLSIAGTDPGMTKQMPVPTTGHVTGSPAADLDDHIPISSLHHLIQGTATVVPYDEEHTRLALGDGGGLRFGRHVESTRLAAHTHQMYWPVAAGHPTEVAGAYLYRFALPTATGGFEVREWGLDNGNNGGPAQLLNHHALPLGFKAGTDTWAVVIAFSHH